MLLRKKVATGSPGLAPRARRRCARPAACAPSSRNVSVPAPSCTQARSPNACALVASSRAHGMVPLMGCAKPPLLRLDAGGLDDLRPFLGLVGDELAEPGRRHRHA